jgi:protein involved in polysaccharide export with SLBB domain
VPVKSPPPQKIQPFGYEIFNLAPTTFEPLDVGPVDPEYPIGPGDEIQIRLWGEVEIYHSLTVDREGQIFIPRVGGVSLNGLTLGEVRNKLEKLLSNSYSGIKRKTVFVDISLGKLKKIKIFILGEVTRPGGYLLSSVTTPLNALYYSGGATERGSLRNIKLIRHNKEIAKIDLYQYLLQGKEVPLRLCHGDVILVPPVGRRVTLTGAVKREGIYELTSGEHLKKLIEIAGGLQPWAYTKKIEIIRIIQNEMKKIVNVNLEKILQTETDFELKEGDEVKIPTILEEMENYVEITGRVYRAGRYELRENMRVKDLIEKAEGIQPDSYLERALIIREEKDRTTRIIRFNLAKALQGEPSENHLLEKKDRIIIRSVWAVGAKKPSFVKISGYVKKPGQYPLHQGMTLRDLIFIAGGLKKEAYKDSVEIARMITKGEKETIKIIAIPLNPSDEAEKFLLQDKDIVFIRKNPYWETQKNVTLKGEVTFPGVYSLIKEGEDRLSDLITRAGGLKPTAYLEGMIFKRKGEVINISLKKALRRKKSRDNIILREGDEIFIPKKPAVVKVKGSVRFPRAVLYLPGKGVNYYIEKAGGFTETADQRAVKLILPSQHVKNPKWLWIFNTRILPGSTIVVPAKSRKREINWGEVIKNFTSVSVNAALIVLIINTLTR